eukprot:9373025-Pyramimonas_sp.AAC.1
MDGGAKKRPQESTLTGHWPNKPNTRFQLPRGGCWKQGPRWPEICSAASPGAPPACWSSELRSGHGSCEAPCLLAWSAGRCGGAPQGAFQARGAWVRTRSRRNTVPW